MKGEFKILGAIMIGLLIGLFMSTVLYTGMKEEVYTSTITITEKMKEEITKTITETRTIITTFPIHKNVLIALEGEGNKDTPDFHISAKIVGVDIIIESETPESVVFTWTLFKSGETILYEISERITRTGHFELPRIYVSKEGDYWIRINSENCHWKIEVYHILLPV